MVVKAGDEYIRVATSVLNPDGSGEQLDSSVGLGARLDKRQANPTMAKSRFLAPHILLRAKSSVSTSSATRGMPRLKAGRVRSGVAAKR